MLLKVTNNNIEIRLDLTKISPRFEDWRLYQHRKGRDAVASLNNDDKKHHRTAGRSSVPVLTIRFLGICGVRYIGIST